MHSTWSNWPGPRRKPVAPKQEQTGLGSGKHSWKTSYTAGQFFAGSTTDTLILSTLAIDVPAFSRLAFIISSASPNCCRTSPGPSGRRSGYQPPMPPTNARFPERMGPPTRCLPGLEDAPWAAISGTSIHVSRRGYAPGRCEARLCDRMRGALVPVLLSAGSLQFDPEWKPRPSWPGIAYVTA